MLLRHATDQQRARFLPPLLRGEEAWCQLFSEPGAGSDLPSLQTRAQRDGDRYIVNGQKVWNSAADTSKRGMLLMRTEPDAPKREGITFAVIDMEQPGVEVRPLRTMNGHAHFCEVFLTDAVVDAADVIGQVNGGWKVARTVLGLERASASQVDARGLVVVRSGELAGHLDRMVGELVGTRDEPPRGYTVSALRAKAMIALAEESGMTRRPLVRQELARYYALTQVHRWNQGRAMASLRADRPAPEGAISKLVLGRICNMSRDLSMQILGASALLAGPDAPHGGEILTIGLSSPGVTIGAGTDEIQRNTIGEQVLGLPREPLAEIDPNGRGSGHAPAPGIE
jgi:alkylation response protein AidB-like acyl-CoA dehydrogenase